MKKILLLSLVLSTNIFAKEIHKKASSGDIAYVLNELNNGENIEVATRNGHTLLHCAASGVQPELASKLVELGANVNATDKDGATPLHAAAHANSLEIVKLLVENGANVYALMTRFSMNYTPYDVAKKGTVADFLKQEMERQRS